MRVDIHKGQPRIMVRIAVVEGEERIRFSSDSPFTVEDDCHSRKHQGRPGQIWEVRVKGGRPAQFAHHLRTAMITDPSQAQRVLNEQQQEDSSAHLLCVGQHLEHGGQVILENREFWICLGPYNSEREVADRAKEKKPGDAHLVAVKDLAGVPQGHVEVVDPDGMVLCLGRRVTIQPAESGHIVLHDSPVGRDFHWQHRERLSYRGAIEMLLGNDGQLLAVNELPMEEYLASVNSSEMDARSPVEFLKAQTVAARSTLLSTAGKHHRLEPFDLCNADHCQCYYGVVREGRASHQAMEETSGEVLFASGRVCDTRYSKVCGGIIESNEHVWPGEPISYLRSGADAPSSQAIGEHYPVNTESKARKWIEATPPAYCNPDVSDLPDYMAYAMKYYRWQVSYGRRELEEIIEKKSGHKIGILQDLRPLARGDSGRISRLVVSGTEGTLALETELEIRRALSTSHLYSSCFVIDLEKDRRGQIERIILRGAGWGHGVGLCQVGAAMMAVRGQKYDQILAHYYPGAHLKKLL